MDPFKLHMEIQNILKGLFFFGVIFRQQGLHFIGNFFRKCGFHATDFIRHLFIITYSKPIFSGVAGSILQDQVKFFDKLFCQCRFCIVNNHINTAKVICCFDYIIHIENFILYANGVGFKNISGLVMGQTATFYVIGVVCQINLCLMVNSTGVFACLLLFQNI